MKREKSVEVLVYIILFLNATDAANTIVLIEQFGAVEVNPFLRTVIDFYGYEYFFLVKTMIVASSLAVLVVLKRTWPLKYVVATFVALIGYQFYMMVIGV